MAINSKKKGNGFERKVANMLSEWSGAKWMRTPMSGAIHNFKDFRVVSDIVPPLSIGKFPFSIECKNVEYDWDFSAILTAKSKFWEHFSQAVDDAKREGLKPMLVFTKNYRDIYCAINYDDFLSLCSGINSIASYILINNKPNLIILINFKDFLNYFTLKQIQDRINV